VPPDLSVTVWPVDSSLRMVRVPPGLTWRALDGGDVVGAVTAFLRPDNRWFIWLDSCRRDAHQPLVAAVVGNVASDLYANADDADPEAAARFVELGFTLSRREGIYLIPTDPARTGLADVAVPDDFDPATYLVAADASGGGYIGLARVWVGPGTPRLGLIGVLPPYQRRGVARALLARAFGVLHERGQAEVTFEIDDTNTASLTLLGGMGAIRKAGTVEFVKRVAT
jgi:ribosomal protein S18 acetylase RimI-like enzyme